MHARLITYVLGVALLIAAAVPTMASQSEQFAGIHDVPRFVCDRVELIADFAVDGSCDAFGPGESLRRMHDAPVPVSCSAICASTAPGS